MSAPNALALVLTAIIAPTGYIILSFLSLLQFQALYLVCTYVIT